MKVAVISGTESGGHPSYVREVVRALFRRGKEVGVEVHLLAARNLEQQYLFQEYPIHCILPPPPRRKRQSLLGFRLTQLRSQLLSERVCLKWLKLNPAVKAVHFQDYFLTTSFIHIRDYKRMGKAVFHTVHNIRPHRYPSVPHGLIDQLARFTWRSCDHLFVHALSLKIDLRAFLNVTRPPISVVPHGMFQVETLKRPVDLSARLAKKKLLFFGGVRRDKGLHCALAMMHCLPDFSLTIAGEPLDTPYWERELLPAIIKLRASGIDVQVIPQFIPEGSLAQMFSEHSIALLPYTRQFEAQSGVLSLAIGLNTPIVATAAGGIAETLGRFAIGEVVQPENPLALSQAVRRLYTRDPIVLQGALSCAQHSLTWEEHACAVCDTYLNPTPEVHRS
jgi:glycosyltransferase involved in cell wall biosynthesis